MDQDKARICVLYDFYGELLPAAVSVLIDYYYNDDLSLSEIAENVDISRQGVRDGIMRGVKLLDEYEDKLGLYKKYKDNKQKVSQIIAELDGIPEEKKEKILSLLDALSF